MNFNKLFKIVSISLFAITIVVAVLYLGFGSSKDCLACDLPRCEKTAENGEMYLAAADDCAKSYDEIRQMEESIRQSNAQFGLTEESDISECSKECLTYASNFMAFAEIMTILSAVITLLFAIYVLIQNPKKIKGVAIGIVSLGAALGISYALASDAIPNIIGYNGVITATEAKWVDTTLYLLYILLATAIVGILATSIMKMFRK